MEQSIAEFLRKAGRFSEEEQQLLTKELQFKTIQKEEILLEKGAVCTWVGFVCSGALYQYTVDDAGHKQVIDLHVAKDWVLNPKSFTSQKPSAYTIAAYQESTLCILTIASIHRLIAKSQAFLQMGKILEVATSRIDFFDHPHSPDEKYLHILKTNPEIAQCFPLKIIASYLKITPETLSRVRNRLSKI